MRVSGMIILLLLQALPALAVTPDEMLTDPALEARARVLSQKVRCLVCQNQSIDESAAPLAHDLRVLVRTQLSKGATDEQVLDFLVARYGEFVLLKPRLTWHTALLWIMPPLILLVGGLTIFAFARRRGDAERPLDAIEERKLATLLPPQDGPPR